METRISILVCICLQTMLRKISTATIELWGHLKELVNRDPVTTESDLVSRVYVACAFVDTRLLQRLQAAISRPAHASLDMRKGCIFNIFIRKHMHKRKFMLLIMFSFFHGIYRTFLSHFISKKISIGS